jgi:ribosomal protein S18 acetylase RimI-like enzyme
VAEIGWLDTADEAAIDAAYRVVRAVMELGGAVGWVHVPDRPETAEWLTGIVAEVTAGRTRMAVVSAGGRIEALGRWTRYAKPTVEVNAEVLQVMVHPGARGGGLAGLLVGALLDDARAHGVETLTLDVRGNNYAAMALYESYGFEVSGRLPDFVAVGDERWDRVLYRLDLRTAGSPVRRHGMRPVGPGASTVRLPGRNPPDPAASLARPTRPA